MKETFLNTWWSQQWLQALGSFAVVSRLSRGRRLATLGLVEDFHSLSQGVTAQVKDGPDHFCKVSARLQPFSEKDKKRILKHLNANFILLSKVLNHELPVDIAKFIESDTIVLWPQSWDDLQVTCTCQEKKTPCKHIAALLYRMVYEIDQDPFLVFQWRGFHLVSALSSTTDSETNAILSSMTFQQAYNPDKEIPVWDEEIYQQLDFTRLPHCRDSLLTILTEKPSFYPLGDFKKILKSGYIGLSEKIKSHQRIASTPSERNTMNSIEDIELLLDENQKFLTTNFRDTKGKPLLILEQKEDLLLWLSKVPRHDFFKFSAPLKSLVLAYDFAIKLVEQSAMIPQLMSLPSGEYMVRWLPALLNPTIKSIYTGVRSILRTDLLFYKKGNKIEEPIDEAKASALIAFFLTALVHQHHNLHDRFREQEVGHLFFNGITQNFGHENTRAYPVLIQQWLANFYLSEKQIVPIFQVTENEKQKFVLEVGVQDRVSGWATPIPLSEILEKEVHRKTRLVVLKDLAILSDFFPKINQLLSPLEDRKLELDANDLVIFLQKIMPTIRLFGIKVLLPRKMRKLLLPKLTIKINHAEEKDDKTKQASVLNLKETLSFSWQVAIGDEVYTEEEFLQMVETYAGIVKLKEDYVFFDEKEIKVLLQKIKNPPPVSFYRLLQSTLTEDYEGAKIALDKKTRALRHRLVKVESIKVPQGLKAILRPYQQSGFEWLYKNIQLGLGSLIADDMGLGKTLQVIATLLKLKEEGILGAQKALVIVPTTLLTNWSKEIKKFAPDLKAFIYHGNNRSMALLEDHEVMITTYGVARSEATLLRKKEWLLLAIDEAQHIKTPGTAQTKAIKKIEAKIKIAMSGTPVENRLSEYWSILDFTNKGFLDSLDHFTNNFARPIEVDRDQEKLEHFRKITSPFILRRLKSDKTIIKDLPDKIESNQYCSLSLEQSALYQNVVKTTMKSIATAKGPERKGLILKLITSLKQVCNHPQQFLKKGSANPTLSGKTQLLFNLLQQIHTNGEKTLIFTQYQEMGRLLVQMIKSEFGWEVPFLHGGLHRKERDQMVDDLQNDRSTRILILSLKAGGTGLNLTAANNVIHYDLWWNPAAEAQATDRAFRIGQRKNVMVHRFITQGTFEEKINDLLQHKKELANLTVSTGEKWIGEFSDAELRDLVKLQ